MRLFARLALWAVPDAALRRGRMRSLDDMILEALGAGPRSYSYDNRKPGPNVTTYRAGFIDISPSVLRQLRGDWDGEA